MIGAMSCTCTQIEKIPMTGRPGVYQYSFKCLTADGRTKRAVLVESDDKVAKRLAEIKCAEVAARE